MPATTKAIRLLSAILLALEAYMPQAACGAAAPAPVSEAVEDGERIYRDFAFSPEFPADKALSLRLRLADPIPEEGLRRFSVYLKSGEGWHAAHVGPSAADFREGRAIRIPLGAFEEEGRPSPIRDASIVRIAAWKNGDYKAVLRLAEADFCAGAPVAVVLSTAATAPNEEKFAAAMAQRCGTILRKCNIEFDFIDDDFSGLAARGDSAAKGPAAPMLVMLPYSPKLSAEASSRLADYVESGGKLAVFYNGDKTLGRALGVDPGPWRKSGDRAYTAIDASPFSAGIGRIPHVTEGVIPPLPLPGRGARKIATWVSGYSLPTHSTAAAISPAGVWFAHVPPRPYPSAVSLMTAIATNLVPSLAASAANHSRPANHANATLPRIPMAAWANSPDIPPAFAGRIPGISALFVRRIPDASGNGGKSRATRIPGVAAHAWVGCFTTEGLPSETIERLRRDGGLSKTSAGWLDPSIKSNRDLIIQNLVAAAKGGADGIHLDYVRTEIPTPQSPETTAAITGFVRDAAKAIRAARPGIEISAAVYPTPESAARHNQDWPAWIAEGLVDYVCPMIYTEFPEEFRHMLGECTKAAPAAKIMAGIGTGSNESQADAGTARREIEIAAESGCRGVVFFTLNDSLTEILEQF